MNKMAKKLKMVNTKFKNPHGLGSLKKPNISSAKDCAIMSNTYI
jgi:hypothetical protein